MRQLVVGGVVLALLVFGCDGGNSSQSGALPAPEPPLPPMTDDVELTIDIEMQTDRRLRIRGRTNLPWQTNLLVSVEEVARTLFPMQAKCSVRRDGRFATMVLGPPDGVAPGEWVAEVTMPLPRLQPESVREVIGSAGEHLRGPLVERDEFGVVVRVSQAFTVSRETP
ncbi:MAG: hypothetical protein ACYSU7_05350 [Planctomycetota bacterium]|jgi:hypothetical protein